MGLFDTITPPSWQGSKTAPTTQRYNLADLWKQYNPQAVQSSFDPNQETKYSGAETGAIGQLSNIIKYGGYSPEQKQTMFSGMMAPVTQQAEQARIGAEADAYSRGLGQSGVLSRSYGDIDKQVMASGAQAMGNIEAQGAGMVLPAIQATQQGQQQLLQMMQQQSQFNAQLAQEKEQLSAQLNMHAGDLQVAITQINAAADMSDADRAMELQRIMNQFNLDATQMQIVQEQARKDRWASFFANLLGGGAAAAGTIAGAAIGAA